MTPQPATPRIGDLFRHYKQRDSRSPDTVYAVTALARDSEDPDRWLVIYTGSHGTWARPWESFVEDVHAQGYHGPRFIPVEGLSA